MFYFERILLLLSQFVWRLLCWIKWQHGAFVPFCSFGCMQIICQAQKSKKLFALLQDFSWASTCSRTSLQIFYTRGQVKSEWQDPFKIKHSLCQLSDPGEKDLFDVLAGKKETLCCVLFTYASLFLFRLNVTITVCSDTFRRLSRY